jgi:phage head maturation protease
VPTIQTFDGELQKTFAHVDANSNDVSILINHDPRPKRAGVAARALLSNPIN